MRGRTDIEMRLRNPNYQRLAKQEKKSRTPPHFTAKNSKSDMIITLLKAGAEFEAQDYCGQTPLRLSLTNGQDRHGRHPFRKPRGDHYFIRAPVRRMKKARQLKPWMSSLGAFLYSASVLVPKHLSCLWRYDRSRRTGHTRKSLTNSSLRRRSVQGS